MKIIPYERASKKNKVLRNKFSKISMNHTSNTIKILKILKRPK